MPIMRTALAAGAFALAATGFMIPSTMSLSSADSSRFDFLNAPNAVALRRIAKAACHDCAFNDRDDGVLNSLVLDFRVSEDGETLYFNNEVLDFSPSSLAAGGVDTVTSAFHTRTKTSFRDLFSSFESHTSPSPPLAYTVATDAVVIGDEEVSADAESNHRASLHIVHVQVTMLGDQEVTVDPLTVAVVVDTDGKLTLGDVTIPPLASVKVSSDNRFVVESIQGTTDEDEEPWNLLPGMPEVEAEEVNGDEELRFEILPVGPDFDFEFDEAEDVNEDDDLSFEILPFMPELEADEVDLDAWAFKTTPFLPAKANFNTESFKAVPHESYDEPCPFGDSPLKVLCTLRSKVMSKFQPRPHGGCARGGRHGSPRPAFVHGGPPKFISGYPAPMHHLPPHDAEDVHALHRGFAHAVHGFVLSVLIPVSVVMSASIFGYACAMLATAILGALIRLLVPRAARTSESQHEVDMEEGEKDGLLDVEVVEEALPVYEDAPVYVEKE